MISKELVKSRLGPQWHIYYNHPKYGKDIWTDGIEELTDREMLIRLNKSDD
jgi:hypothetical protein